MASGQLFNLRWNCHTNIVFQVLADHFTEEMLVDVTLSCEGKFIKAHKIVLSACSPYFQEIFRSHQVAHPMIIFHSMGFEELNLIINFMYRGEVKVQESILQSVLRVAELLQVKGLSTIRSKYDEASGQKTEQKLNQALPPLTSNHLINTSTNNVASSVTVPSSVTNVANAINAGRFITVSNIQGISV